jgi:hypothetical protein
MEEVTGVKFNVICWLYKMKIEELNVAGGRKTAVI